MITAELFILLKLFTINQVSWWWVVLFIASDISVWASIRNIFGGEI